MTVTADQPRPDLAPSRKWRRMALVLAIAAVAVGAFVLYKQLQTTDPLTAGLRAHAEGRLVEARENYELVLETDPGNKYAHYNLGLIDQVSGNLDSATRHYELALRTDEDYAPATFNLATVETARGSDEKAIRLYRRLLVLEPNNALAHLNLGFALRATGHIEEGRAELDRAIAIDPRLESRRTEQADGEG